MTADEVVKLLGSPSVDHTSPARVPSASYPEGIASIIGQMKKDFGRVREWNTAEWFILIGFGPDDRVKGKVMVRSSGPRPGFLERILAFFKRRVPW
jgi:hypothetical protein